MFIKGENLNKCNINNILLIQFGDIGDVVYSLPCVRALRETFPSARVVMAVQKKAEGLVSDCLWADDIISVDKQKRPFLQNLIYQKNFWLRVRSFKFDLVIDLRTGSRGAILAFLSGAKQRVGRYTPVGNVWRSRLFTHLVLPTGRNNQYIAEYYHDTIAYYGIKTTNLNPEITPSRNNIDTVANLFKNENIPSDQPIWAIQPFSLWRYKEWGIEKYIELINRVTREFKISVILTGAPNERDRAQEIVHECENRVFNFAGLTTMELLPALFQASILFLGVDSAGVHIAAAVGTPTISLYGPSSPDIWAPKGEKHRVISKKMPCVPCKETGCNGSKKSKCMDSLAVDDVLNAVRNKLKDLIGKKQ